MKTLSKIFFILFLMLSFKPGLRADLSMTDTTLEVNYRGTREIVGNVFMQVEDDDFNTASVATPVFIQVVLSHEAVLARTLVDLSSGDPVLTKPIYLALILNNEEAGIRLAAPPQTISIIRWLAGESSFWIEVQVNTGAWIDFNGELGAPREGATVSFGFGFRARSSSEIWGPVSPQRKNLPFNTRNPNLAPDAELFEDATSTLICVDLSMSSLETVGRDNLLIYSPITFGPEAEPEPGVLLPADPLDIIFKGNFSIGFGKKKGCTANLVARAPVEVRSDAATDPGFQSATNQMEMRVHYDTGPEFIDVFLLDGDKLTLSVGNRGAYGFSEEGAKFIGEGIVPGQARLLEPFDINGRTLYRKVELTWTSGLEDLDAYPLEVETTIHYFWEGDPVDVLLDWDLSLENFIQETDEPPFDGPDQVLQCRSGFQAGRGLWHFGTVGNRFASGRMITHLTRAAGGFSTRLLLSNPTPQNHSWLLTAYGESGDFLTSASGEMEAGKTIETGIQELFPVPGAAYLTVSGDSEMIITAVYQADRANVGPAHIPESTVLARTWLVYPGNPEVTWDGIALVNAGAVSTHVTVSQKTFAGEIVDTRIIQEALAPGAKALSVLNAEFTFPANTYFEITAGEPLALIALRGNPGSDFLWENRAIPVLD